MARKQIFEIAVYNQTVRQLVADGASHRWLSDSWADVHYIEIEAGSALTARLAAAARFPGHRGFVIVDVMAPELTC